MKDQILALSQAYFEEIRGYRRHLHQNPELSFKEYNTAKFVSEKLNDWGVEHQTGIAGSGILATLKGNKTESDKVIALRADMDALPIQEINTAEYASQNDGVMHACGHDAHTSCLLGAVKILQALQAEWGGTVKFIFQPGEERLPGGASLMIKEGIFCDPIPDKVYGLHVAPAIDCGHLGFRPNAYMASADEVYLTVHGKGGHAALPHLNVDPVVITAQIITALQSIVSRVNSPYMPSVLSFGKVEANGATNVTPDKVTLAGTFRAFDDEARFALHDKIKHMAQNIAIGMGGICEVDIRVGYPAVVNDEEITLAAKSKAQELVGAEKVIDLDMRMTGEDFSFYLKEVPGCFYRLGTKKEGLPAKRLHTPDFDIDEDALKTGMAMMAWLVVSD